MFGLTAQQRTLIVCVLLMLVVGWAVKAWRASQGNPPAAVRTR